MVSVASGGTTERIAARILFNVLRAGSGTPARYSSTFFGAPLPFAAELRLQEFTFFTRAMVQERPLQVHAPGNRRKCQRRILRTRASSLTRFSHGLLRQIHLASPHRRGHEEQGHYSS